ncbi:Protein of unknown function DUF2039 [Macleaya cordata]|uniref:Uncharacterized protein n=1 Tax=Macleaya cordata TaxID=56857 RepID=A0A200PRN0_MACCD|nr:Protein of unknown function DUF2039 [Macleaya cordata]
MSGGQKHQNKHAWKPDANRKKNDTELGGRLKPFSEITGVCSRCRDQIQWKRKYGKYKALIEPAKCQRCSKRNVRQAYHNLCSGCAKDLNVCAKCSCHVERIIGRDLSEVEAEKKTLEEAIKNARERDRRALLRAMNKGKTGTSVKTTINEEGKKVGELFPAESLDEYAELNREDEDEDDDNEDQICN